MCSQQDSAEHAKNAPNMQHMRELSDANYHHAIFINTTPGRALTRTLLLTQSLPINHHSFCAP
jgi:hypothetical protein